MVYHYRIDPDPLYVLFLAHQQVYPHRRCHLRQKVAWLTFRSLFWKSVPSFYLEKIGESHKFIYH